MKIAHYSYDGQQCLGVVDVERACVYRLNYPTDVPLAPNSWLELLALGDTQGLTHLTQSSPVSLTEVKLHAPIAEPRRNIFCVGKNYHDHAREFSRSGYDSSVQSNTEIPDQPIFFTKATTTIIGPGDYIKNHRGVTQEIDYEAELAVIIGKPGSNIRVEHAYAHVFGYTIINDVTARDLQKSHKQWFKGKSLDSFCPMGPWIVTADEIDPATLELRCWVNNELRQQAHTRDLIFDIPRLIADLSAGMRLIPGDILATGTPAGVGIGFTPPRFLQPCDTVRIEITGIGTLQNQLALND